ncbi:MAG: hypothetical protein H2055_01345 [Sphingopyxis sp.]|nr:hypothetical protein [Sphingopyxis sp.]
MQYFSRICDEAAVSPEPPFQFAGRVPPGSVGFHPADDIAFHSIFGGPASLDGLRIAHPYEGKERALFFEPFERRLTGKEINGLELSGLVEKLARGEISREFHAMARRATGIGKTRMSALLPEIPSGNRSVIAMSLSDLQP